ncbi:MAG: hypothetical protein AAFV47_14555 [Pseudomonadota bacterium]
MKRVVALFALLSFPVSQASAETPGGQGQILSAFFGLDNSRRIRFRTVMACRGFKGSDGMPVIFSKEIDENTLDPGDFRITTASGNIGRVGCVTLRPADEPGEKRTVLVIGEYGFRDDQPVTVKISGDLISLDGRVNFKGTQADVIPLESGPTMILSEIVRPKNWHLGTSGNCPRDGVKSVVRVTWTGGITKPGGEEIDDKERQLYRVTVRRADGGLETVTPIAIADLNDNDNNHDLCLGIAGEPLSVFFPAGALTDPNEDLNPDTTVKVSAARS